MRTIKKLAVGAALTLVALPTSAAASTLTLEAVTLAQAYQQTANRPCVIGESSCNYVTPISPDADAVITVSNGLVNKTSARFYVSTLRSLFGGTGNDFWVGFDVNQSSVDQTLDYFAMFINGVLVDSFGTIGGGVTTVPPTVGGGNGNGYADYLFKGFTSLAGYAATDIVTFQEIMPLTNAGKEQFFLIEAPCSNCEINQTGTVPEPASLLLLGTGLVAVAARLRRRKA